MIVENRNEKAEDDCACLFETTEISKPIKNIVGLSVDSVQVQIKFVGHCNVGGILYVLIWSYCVRLYAKDLSFKLCNGPELHIQGVL